MSKGSTTTSQVSQPSWLEQDSQNLIGQAANQTNADISSIPYSQDLGTINNTNEGIIQGQQVNGANLANGITSAGSASWTNPGTASSFMSPYENTALASQVSLDKSTLLDPELANANSGAAASNALGGDRSAVLNANLTNNFNNTEANTIAQGENTAYNTGLNAYESEAARNLQSQEAGAQTQLSAAGQNTNTALAGTQNLLSGISASEAPGQQLASEAGILASAPNMSTVTQTQTPNGGALGGILGGLLGGTGQLLTGIGNLSGGGLVRKKTRRLKKKRAKK